MTLAPGTTLGRYQILEPLGQGGMATVYKAYQPSLQREVALKVLRPGYAQDAEFRERFEREAIAIAKLRHPNVVAVHDFDEVEGRYLLVMEYLEGGTLKRRLAALADGGEGLPLREAARIVREVADALTYAHQLGVVHRDVKPANVMLTRDGRAVVTDFGIAKILAGTQHTQTGVGIGTPEYMSPEQGQGRKVDHRADIYSLGVMAFELLTGRVPFIADTPLAVVLSHVRDPLPLPSTLNPQLGPRIERTLLRALAKDPEDRFGSATQFAQALEDAVIAEAKGTVATVIVRRPPSEAEAPPPPRPVVPRGGPRRRALYAGVAILFAGAAAVLFDLGSVFEGVLGGLAGVPKGALVWEAKLDGTSADYLPAILGNGSVRPTAGAIELSIASPLAADGAYAKLRSPSRATYVLELALRFEPAPDAEFGASFRGEGASLYEITVNASTRERFEDASWNREGIYLNYYGSEGSAAPRALTPLVPVPGLGTGRTFTVAVAVETQSFTLFLDGAQVARSAYHQYYVAPRLDASPHVPRLKLSRGTGTVRVLAARVYELAR